MKKLFSLLLLVFCFNIIIPAQQFEVARLDSFVLDAMKMSKAQGFALGIIKDGNIIFKKGYGTTNSETAQRVATSSLFGIASCSKAFTAAAIALLVEEGKLNWDDRVIDILPSFKLHDPYVTREIRIEDLLCHRSGFDTFDGDLLWYGTKYSREEILKRISLLPLKNSFRMKYGYSNVMYIAAGEVIKAVTGKSWDEFLTERFFLPLKMTSTTTSNVGFENRDDIARPHLEGKPEPFINYDNAGPAASINSNIDDLLKWTNMWLNNGAYGEQRILSPAAIYKLTSPHLMLPPPKKTTPLGIHFRAYALGWFLNDYNGRLIVRHDGGLPGYLSRILLVPEEKLGIVMLTNDMSWINEAVSSHLLGLFMNIAPERTLEDLAKIFDHYKKQTEQETADRVSKRVLDTNHSLDLSEYAGSYSDKMYGDVRVELKDNSLFFEMLPTKELFCGELEHWHYNTFRVVLNDPYLPFGLINFELDENGKVAGFKIDLPNPDFHFYNLHFTKMK